MIKVAVADRFQLKVVPSIKNFYMMGTREVHYIGGTEVLPAPLDIEEEKNVLAMLKTDNDDYAKKMLIEHNLRLVVYIAKKFDNTGVGVEDLISIGTIGLIKAINSYDRDKNIKLATYASRCIENEILMYLRRNSKVKAEVSIDEPLNVDWDGNELLLSDILGTEDDVCYKDLENEVEMKALKRAIGNLSERERIIVDLRYGLSDKDGEEKTQKEVADMLGISQSYISRLEKKIIKHNIHFAIFCSPHNPTGRVWKKEEIQKFIDICKKYDVLVFSDEIWSDLVRKENTHIPTQSVSEDAKKRTIAAYAPSKTFNLAGLVGSYHIIYNKHLRDRLNKQASLSHYNSPNILSIHALMGAYCKDGLDWVSELNEVIANNVDFAIDFIHTHFKGIEVIKPEGTYMLYLDCTKYLDTHDITMDELLKKGVRYGVCWQDGRPFMNPNTIRMNLALPTSLVEEAFSRLKEFVF